MEIRWTEEAVKQLENTLVREVTKMIYKKVN